MLKYLGTIFSESDGASFSRYATAVTVLTGCGCLVYTVLKSHGLPEGGSLLALGGFITAPYAVNKGTAIFTRRGDGPTPGTLPSVSAGGTTRVPSDTAVFIALGIYALCFFYVFTLMAIRMIHAAPVR